MVEHPSPHDALFKAVFEKPANAVAILQAALPAELVAAIDPGSLALEHGTFVDEALRYRHSDLLFKATVGGEEALLYFLLEHLSSVERLWPVRGLRYVSRVIDAWLARNPEADRIPAVIPVILFQGPGAWTGARRLSELVRLPTRLEATVRPRTAELALSFQELPAQSHAALLALAAPLIARIALVFLKCAREPGGVLAALSMARDLLRQQLTLPSGAEALYVVWSYTHEVGDLRPEAVVEEVRRVVGPEVADSMKSTAEQLREQGFEKGLEKGLEQGASRVLEALLQAKFGALPPWVEARLASSPATELERLALRVLRAATLEDVFAAG